MFETLLVKPIINLLIGIYAIIPGHNFGLALIVFTVIVRFLMWPMVRRQLHHTQQMRKLQPEIRKIKKEAAGDRQKEALATMTLYKERGVSPFAGFGYLLVQLPIFIALYQGVSRISNDASSLISSSYGFIQDLSWMNTLAADISQFDSSFFGIVDLTRKAVEENGVYYAGLAVVLLSAIIQYYSSKMLLDTGGRKRGIREMLRAQAAGEEVDRQEVSQVAGRISMFIIPGLVLLISLNLILALPFYWLVNGMIAYYQQKRVIDQVENAETEVRPPKKNQITEITGSGKTTTRVKSSPKKASTKSRAKAKGKTKK